MAVRIEQFGGRRIRFFEVDGEWWAAKKDICDALKIHDKDASKLVANDYFRYIHKDGVGIVVINETGILMLMAASKRLDMKKFQIWSFEVMRKLRSKVGLQGYEVLHLADDDVQDDIDRMLDGIYWDEEKQCMMQSVTVEGGDVEQVELEGF